MTPEAHRARSKVIKFDEGFYSLLGDIQNVLPLRKKLCLPGPQASSEGLIWRVNREILKLSLRVK